MSSQLKARRLQPNIGAEIEGVDLSKPLSRESRDQIYAALLEHKVIFFRDQKLSREQHVALARSFGDLEPAPDTGPSGHPDVFLLYGDASSRLYSDIWHADQTHRVSPPLGAILRSVTLPSLGGDTLFSNVTSAYYALDEKVRARIDGLKAMHDYTMNMFRYRYTPEQVEQALARSKPIEQPVVAVHPDTGERLLFVNPQYTSHIIGIDEQESRELLRMMFDEIAKPDHQVRFTWRPNSVAFWDNRAVQHYAVSDYSEPREMERVAIQGLPVVGLDGVRTPHRLPELEPVSQ